MKNFLLILLVAISFVFAPTTTPAKDVCSNEFRQQSQQNFILSIDQKSDFTNVIFQARSGVTEEVEQSTSEPAYRFKFESITASVTKLVLDPITQKRDRNLIIFSHQKTTIGSEYGITPRYFYGNSRINMG